MEHNWRKVCHFRNDHYFHVVEPRHGLQLEVADEGALGADRRDVVVPRSKDPSVRTLAVPSCLVLVGVFLHVLDAFGSVDPRVLVELALADELKPSRKAVEGAGPVLRLGLQAKPFRDRSQFRSNRSALRRWGLDRRLIPTFPVLVCLSGSTTICIVGAVGLSGRRSRDGDRSRRPESLLLLQRQGRGGQLPLL